MRPISMLPWSKATEHMLRLLWVFVESWLVDAAMANTRKATSECDKLRHA